jgi:hypothetical protein
MPGYWRQPSETGNALRDGWLFTGDIGKMDAEGYFTIVDRRKDMILVSGCDLSTMHGFWAPWLAHELRNVGLEIVCLDTRHTRAAPIFSAIGMPPHVGTRCRQRADI